jgi:hypothetical protein
MATLKEAERARKKAGDMLHQMGAHAILVDEVDDDGGKSFAVIALFEKKPETPAPPSVEVSKGKKTVQVPLRFEESPMIELE